MRLVRLKVDDLRNLREVDTVFGPGLNFIVGENGSGKTSLLEAVFLLGLGRSFRGHKTRSFVREGAEKLTVFGEVENAHGIRHRIGLEKKGGLTRIVVDGGRIGKAAELAKFLPVQILEQGSYRLLDQGPKFRRQFLDWGVFHVEHKFYPLWHRYYRALKQRNAALRQNKAFSVCSAWNCELAQTAAVLHELRATYTTALLPLLNLWLEKFSSVPEVSLEYRAGWDVDQNLADILAEQTQADARVGHTRHGPHRADLILKTGGVPAMERFSRGQQKILVYALTLAQAALLREKLGETSVVLVDDLAAELDEGHQRTVLRALRDIGGQVLITGTHNMGEAIEGSKMFHVEQGRVSEMV